MKLLLLSTALLLTACGPVYRTNYNLFPPESKEGQVCVRNVKLMSDTCTENCRQMSRSCRNPGGFTTSVGFGTGAYSHSGIGYGYNNDIFNDRDCNATQCIENCLTTARTAHVNCGGTIKEEVVCTSNCPKPTQPSPTITWQ